MTLISNPKVLIFLKSIRVYRFLEEALFEFSIRPNSVRQYLENLNDKKY